MNSLFKTYLKRSTFAFVFFHIFSNVCAQSHPPTIVGKNNWLFTKYEMIDPQSIKGTDITLDLISRFNKILVANGIEMLMVLVPIKIRIYSEFLPPSIILSKSVQNYYEHTIKVLHASKVNVVDLNAAFLDSPLRTGDLPLYLRLDTHWSPSGALLAAETIKKTIIDTPVLKKAYDETPFVQYKIEKSKERKRDNSRDLASFDLLPANYPEIPIETTLKFKIIRSQSDNGLLSNSGLPQVGLIGSSYSSAWTGFSAALNYELQRDVVNVSTTADRGSWVGVENYLRNRSFELQRPKLLIWEMPERDVRLDPAYMYRAKKYQIDKNEWLLRVSALIQKNCVPSTIQLKSISTNSLESKSFHPAGLTAGATREDDYVEITLSGPLTKMDYLSFNSSGTNEISLQGVNSEASAKVLLDKLETDSHAIKYPLIAKGIGFSTVRVYPGVTKGFTVKDFKICRQPNDLLS